MGLNIGCRVVATLSLALGAAVGVHTDHADARPGRGVKKTPPLKVGRSAGPGKSKPTGLVDTSATSVVATPLSLADKKELLKGAALEGEPGTVYARVDPREMMMPKRAGLVAANPMAVNPLGNALIFPPFDGVSYAGLWIKSAHSGARYLVDCQVDVLPEFGTASGYFNVKHGSKSVMMAPAGHLAWVLESSDNKWHSFRIVAPSVHWALRYCEVTNL